MVDYLKALDESYIPLNIQEGIEMMTEEIYDTIQNEYRTLQFNKDYTRIVQGLLEEDYPLIKEAAHSIKGALGYLLPLVVDKISNELQTFILKRIDTKTDKAKLPFLPQDKIKVYKDGYVILTEMIALQRYFTKKFPEFDTPYKKEEAKQLIDKVYKKQQEIFKANSSPGTEKKIAGSEKNIEKQGSTNNQADKDKLKKSQAANIETSMKIKDSQSANNNNNNNINNNNNTKSLKESTARQHTQENEQTKEKDNKSEKKLSTLIAVPEKNNEDIDIAGQGNQNPAEESALKNHSEVKEEGVGNHDIKIENHEKVQPCCNACNIF